MKARLLIPGLFVCRFTESLTEAKIEAFAAGILDGTIQPKFKSEDIPEAGQDLDGHVQIVVGKTFDAIVKDPKKDVLLEVYAPWCGHCKNLEPIYKKLATRFKDIDSVVVAKMDGTANEHAELEVQAFPHIMFFPAKEGAEGMLGILTCTDT
jgi:protein disulfide-isomerase A1